MIRRLEIGDPRWLEFVSRSGGATAFHHPSWAALLGDCYRYPAFALVLEDRAGAIVAGLPIVDVSNRITGKRWVSLPYTDVCAPLTDGASLDELVVALDEERTRRGIAICEVRAELPGRNAARPPNAVIHTLPLAPAPEDVERRFKPTVRQHIRKGLRAGVTVRRAETAEDVADIFYGLHLRTRRRLGVPAQPRRYFLRLWERIITPGLGFCLLAESERRPIAGAIFLAWKDTLVYKYSASEQRPLRPNYVLLWDAIRWGGANDFDVMDMGRTDLDHHGLRQFKSAWGAQEEPLVYSVLGNAGGRGSAARGARMLEPLIKRSPPFVCRAIGELLYKYAA